MIVNCKKRAFYTPELEPVLQKYVVSGSGVFQTPKLFLKTKPFTKNDRLVWFLTKWGFLYAGLYSTATLRLTLRFLKLIRNNDLCRGRKIGRILYSTVNVCPIAQSSKTWWPPHLWKTRKFRNYTRFNHMLRKKMNLSIWYSRYNSHLQLCN